MVYILINVIYLKVTNAFHSWPNCWTKILKSVFFYNRQLWEGATKSHNIQLGTYCKHSGKGQELIFPLLAHMGSRLSFLRPMLLSKVLTY